MIMPYENKTGYPSVTEILRPWISTEWFTEESRERGTAVHAACAAHLINQYVIPLKKAWRGYFDSFRLWCDESNPYPLKVEERLIDKPFGYCGKPDFIGKLGPVTSDIGVVDWKTGISVEKYWPLQIAAYRHLVNEKHTKWGMNLRLRADGKLPLATKYHDQTMDFNIFLGALNLHKYFKEGRNGIK